MFDSEVLHSCTDVVLCRSHTRAAVNPIKKIRLPAQHRRWKHGGLPSRSWNVWPTFQPVDETASERRPKCGSTLIRFIPADNSARIQRIYIGYPLFWIDCFHRLYSNCLSLLPGFIVLDKGSVMCSNRITLESSRADSRSSRCVTCANQIKSIDNVRRIAFPLMISLKRQVTQPNDISRPRYVCAPVLDCSSSFFGGALQHIFCWNSDWMCNTIMKAVIAFYSTTIFYQRYLNTVFRKDCTAKQKIPFSGPILLEIMQPTWMASMRSKTDFHFYQNPSLFFPKNPLKLLL